VNLVGPLRTKADFILASASPRRRTLLQNLGLDFEIFEARIEERPEPGETPQEFVLRAACDKTSVISARNPASWVLGADTVVVHGNRILGKPKNSAEALQVLLSLSGRRHLVHTGFSLKNEEEQALVSRVVTTEVSFFHFTRELAAAYVATGEPLDKAGAYGIQGIGGFLVEKINGSFSNVVGLPLVEVIKELLHFKVVVTGQ
jgi:septum formation protein